MRTRAETRFKVLSILIGGDVGIDPSDEDASAVDRYIDDAIAELEAKNIVSVSDADNVPNSIFSNYCEFIANAAADDFGAKSDPKKKRFIENELRLIAAGTPGYGPQQIEYF